MQGKASYPIKSKPSKEKQASQGKASFPRNTKFCEKLIFLRNKFSSKRKFSKELRVLLVRNKEFSKLQNFQKNKIVEEEFCEEKQVFWGIVSFPRDIEVLLQKGHINGSREFS